MMLQFIFITVSQYKLNILSTNMNAPRNSQFGRGKGSFRVSEVDKVGNTPQKKRSSFKLGGKKMKDFDPKQFIVAQCSVRDVQIFKQVFDFLDDDHDGMLTPLDLRKAIRQYGGYKPGRAFVYVAMSVFDADDGGQISFKQFVKLMTQKPCQSDTIQDIERIFQYIDQQNKGCITQQDLMAMAQQLHQELSKAQIKQMIQHCDPNGNGIITKQAFVTFNKRKNFD